MSLGSLMASDTTHPLRKLLWLGILASALAVLFLAWPGTEESTETISSTAREAEVPPLPEGELTERAKPRAPDSATADRPIPTRDARQYPPGAIEGEMVLRFRYGPDFGAFVQGVQPMGGEVLEFNYRLRAVRVAYEDEATRRRLESLARRLGNAQEEFNYFAGAPAYPSEPELANLQPFGEEALKALGVSEVDPTWGEGVTIAVFDTGLSAHAIYGERSLPSEVDYVEEGASEGPYAGHGNAVAALIAAESEALPGLAQGADLRSYRVMDADGLGDTFTIAHAIVEAIDRGVDVLSLSLGTTADSALLRDAIAYAQENGAVVVAAAGNDGQGRLLYPAAYEGVIAVGATQGNGSRAGFSSYGEGLDLLAPGVGVSSAWEGEQFVSFSGTSASVPLTSAAIAVLVSEGEADDVQAAAALLVTTASEMGRPGYEKETGAGRIDLQRALGFSTGGTIDLAVTDVFLEAPEGSQVAQTDPEAGQVTVWITVENQGTAWIQNAQLEVNVGDEENPRYFYPSALDVSQAEAFSLVVPASQISPEGGLALRTSISLENSEDARPENNSREGVLQVHDPEPAPDSSPDE